MDSPELSDRKSKLHSFIEACRPSSLRSRAKSWNWPRLIVSFWGCVSFVGLGTSLIVFSSTLLDIAAHLSEGVGVLAVMFTCRAIGSGIGSVSSGVILDKYASSSYMILSAITFSCVTTTIVVPLSIHVALLGVFMFFNGIATGALENGVHAVLMRLWGSKSGPCMQVLHFSWAFGAFVAPLIAKRFIHEIADETDYFNGTCSDLWTSTASTTAHTQALTLPPVLESDLDCFHLFTELCNNLTDTSSEESESLYFADMDCANSTTAPTSPPSTDFKYAYFIAASLFLPSLVAFIVYAVRRECLGRLCARVSDESKEEETDASSALSTGEEYIRPPLYFTIIFFTLLFSFMFLYVGLEAGYGALILTVAVKGQLNLSKSSAAVLQSVYWGTFCFTRMVSIIFAILKVRATIMICGNLFGSFIASLIMIFYIHNATAIWIGSAVLGMSYASIFPTAMTWMSENAKATGKATAVLVTAGTVGDITLPAVMGVIVAKISPDSLFYFTFVGVIVSAATAAVMFLTAYLQKRRQRSARDGKHEVRVRYRQLEDETSIECDGDVDVDEEQDVKCANGSATVHVDVSEDFN